MIAILSRPTPPPRRLWKRLALCEAFPCLWCAHGGKGSDDRKPFSPLARGRHVFGSVLPCAKHSLPLVRARGAHGKTAAHGPKAKRRLSIGGEPSGSGRLRARRRRSFGGALRRPLANGRADGSLTLRVQTVLQCAPRARTQGGAMAKHLAKRFQKHAGQRLGERKARASTNLSLPTPWPRSLPFHGNARGARGW